ncbi:MAG: hypothetical protein WAV38_39615 [Xanthobacteraceae bacterium]
MSDEERMTATEVAHFHAEGLRLRWEAAEMLKRAEAKDHDGEYKLGQSDWRLREIQALEKNIAAREKKLEELGEAALLAREQAADDKLKQAKELMASWDTVKHGAAQALIDINKRDARAAAAREKAEQSAA